MSDFNYAKKGTLLGFSYDNIHSSTLGIVRVSDGSEFTQELLPSFTDYTVDAVGRDGVHYYGGKYNTRNFSISFAFCGISDSQLRQIQKTFAADGLHYLTYDETPYKSYRVKIASPPQIRYNIMSDDYECKSFDLYNGSTFMAKDRFYSGMGTLQFIAYDPFAVSRPAYFDANEKYAKYRNQFEAKSGQTPNLPEWKNDNGVFDYNLYNFEEWKDSARLIDKTLDPTPMIVTKLDTFKPDLVQTQTSGTIYVYNPGDLDTPFYLNFTLRRSRPVPETQQVIIGLQTQTFETSSYLEFEGDLASRDEIGYRVNTNLHLIEGLTSLNTPSGRILNRCITSGDFFTIPQTSGPIEMVICKPAEYDVSIDYAYRFY